MGERWQLWASGIVATLLIAAMWRLYDRTVAELDTTRAAVEDVRRELSDWRIELVGKEAEFHASVNELRLELMASDAELQSAITDTRQDARESLLELRSAQARDNDRWDRYLRTLQAE